MTKIYIKILYLLVIPLFYGISCKGTIIIHRPDTIKQIINRNIYIN